MSLIPSDLQIGILALRGGVPRTFVGSGIVVLAATIFRGRIAKLQLRGDWVR
jgi:hypothetical protein